MLFFLCFFFFVFFFLEPGLIPAVGKPTYAMQTAKLWSSFHIYIAWSSSFAVWSRFCLGEHWKT